MILVKLDTIHPGKLREKLYYYGISIVCYELMKSYLMDKEQTSTWNRTSSVIAKVTHVVPQGFVLGLMLDVMYRKLSSMLKILLF